MKTMFVLFLALLFSLSLHAQEPGDSIIVKKAFFGNKYFVDSNKVSRDMVGYIAGSDQHTQKLLRVSRIQRSVGSYVLAVGVISAASIFYKAWENRIRYEHWFTARNPVNIYAAIGSVGGLSLGALTLYESNWNFQKAINIYNTDIPISKQTTELNFNIGLNYLSLTYRF